MAASGDPRRQVKYEIYRLYDSDETGLKTGSAFMDHGGLLDIHTDADYVSKPGWIYYVIASNAGYTFDNSNMSPDSVEILVTFKGLSMPTNKVSTALENSLEKLLAVYDGCSMTLDGWTLREMSRPFRNDVIGPLKHVNMDTNKEEWYCDVNYVAILDKS